MKIVVLNGSPKGMTSVTMQYVRFLQKKFPQHEFTILHVASELLHLEDSPSAFQKTIDAVAEVEAVLWAFPLYVLLVHAHYKRFIELIGERQVQAAFQGRYAAVLTTSIRFFDHTAHNYVHGICDDLDMKYWGGYSAEMYDLLKDDEQKRFLRFAEDFFAAVAGRTATSKVYPPVQCHPFDYVPGPPGGVIDARQWRTLVVTDAQAHDTNLNRMIDRFRNSFAEPPEVINLQQVKIRAGCMGCIQCGLDNVCVYRETDEIYEVYQRLMLADVLVLAGSIRDRYLSSRWKLFFDRGFFNNHVPIFVNKQMGYLISGPLQQIPNLRTMLEAHTELHRANLAGIVTDECVASQELDQLVDGLARRLVWCAQTGYIGPPMFHGVAGRKLFRDEIWGSLRFVFHADHRYYKQHGLYDFPRRSLKQRLMTAAVTLLTKIPPFRKKFLQRIRTEMIKPLERIVDNS